MNLPAMNASTEPSPLVKNDLARLRQSVGQVVGSVFYGTLLKALRESSLKGAYGHGGRGEEVFAAQLHGLMAERMGAAAKRGLPELLYRGLERQQRLISARRNQAEGG